MKRIWLLTLVLAMCIVFVIPAHVSADLERFRGTTIRVLDVSRSYHKAGYDFIVPMFEKKYGIKVEIEEVPFEKMREKTLLEMTGRTGRYDCIAVDCMWLAEFVSAGYLSQLYRYINDPELYDPAICDINDFVPRAFSGQSVYNDTIYAMPLSPGMSILFIRKDLLQQHGLSIPTNRQEFYEVAKKVNDPANEIYGVTLQASRGMNFSHNWLDYMYSYGGEIFDEKWHCIINSPESLKALKFYLSLKPFTPPGSGTFGWDEVLTVFGQGHVLMGAGYNPFMMYFEDPEVSKVAGKVAYALIPEGPAGRYALYGSWGMGISVDSKNKEAAWLWLQYLTGTEVAKQWAMVGGPPSRHSIFQDKEVQDKWPWIPAVYDFMLKDANPDFRTRIPEWAEIAEAIGLWGNQAWLEKVTPEQSLVNMQRDVEAIMERGGYFSGKRTLPAQHWRDLTYYDRLPSEWEMINVPKE